jgi:peptidyl-tRNA hydrolase
MYILVKDSIDLGYAMVAVAHASLAAYLKFKESAEVEEWLAGPFRKVVCRVSEEAFEAVKCESDHVVITESALGGSEVALAFKPRVDWAKSFKFFRLYK